MCYFVVLVLAVGLAVTLPTTLLYCYPAVEFAVVQLNWSAVVPQVLCIRLVKYIVKLQFRQADTLPIHINSRTFFLIDTGNKRQRVSCHYVSDKDAMLVNDGESINVRKDLSGMYMLDTALGCRVESEQNDMIKLELTLTDVII